MATTWYGKTKSSETTLFCDSTSDVEVDIFSKTCIENDKCCAFNTQCQSLCCDSGSMKCIAEGPLSQKCIKWGNNAFDTQKEVPDAYCDYTLQKKPELSLILVWFCITIIVFGIACYKIRCVCLRDA